MSLKHIIRNSLRKLGVSVRRYPSIFDQGHIRSLVFKHLEIDLVLDVGANVGSYGAEIREFGYTGQIISFEPVKELYDRVCNRAKADPHWSVQHCALGDTDGTAEINVANDMSSLLDRAANDNDSVNFAFQRKETISIARLDTILPRLVSGKKNIWLKLDVQGFEMQALAGAARSLELLSAVETELSLWAFYQEQHSYRQLIDHLAAAGFDLWTLSGHGAHPKNGRMADFDGIFVRHATAVAG